jgi:bifunctional UDP-N-acetylglucosamine pyrophosphorylase/glucosamine-1-phosphate N-acetyltransferase
METPITVVILAAGLGTRMKSRKAKVLHRAGGLTLIEQVVDTVVSLTPPDRIYVVTGHQAGQVEAAAGNRGVQFVRQKDQKGTGHALMSCRERLASAEGLLLVLYGDCPLLSANTLSALIARQSQSNAAATLITTVLDDPTGYGRIIRDERGNVSAIFEQKAASPAQLAIREINSGIYCFQSAPLWKHIVEIQTNNPAGEYYLTDMAEILTRAGHTVAPFPVADSAELLGINDRAELAGVDRIFRERKARELMRAGVTIEKPETVTIDGRVAIGIDSVVEPFAQILGETTIGEECRIGACSIIQDSRLGDRVTVGPFTIIGTSRVERDARIGPFSRLRMDNEVGEGAHVGNFVELKKTRLGAGAKSMHLAYLGDSIIGEKTNIGAGTITCNYDGAAKHQTRIGEGAFVGSNSTLVAPVEIGAGSYVAAGSTITESVPADALALGRARQENKAEWAKKRRQKGKGK